MKKTFKRIIPFVALIGAMTMSGCSMYSSKADTLENIVGFYELDVWSGKHEATDEETYDRKAEEGTVAYFTIDKDGYAYYGFKDNNTEPWVRAAFATYKHDDDEPELYEAVTVAGKVDTVYAWEKHVGCLDEPIMGFKRQEIVVEKKTWPMKSKTEMVSTLSYTIPWHEYTWYKPHKIQKYQYVSYKKISDETGYEVINQKLGTHYAPTRPYELEGMTGRLVYRAQPVEGSSLDNKGLYEYAVLDMDSYANGKVNLYYSLKATPGQVVEQVPVEIYEPGKSVKATIFDRTFYSDGNSFSTHMDEYAPDDVVNSESFFAYYGTDATLDFVIDQEMIPQNGPYVMHTADGSSRKYVSMGQNESYELVLDDLELAAGEEFYIECRGYNSLGRLSFEHYQDDGTAHDKIVEGSEDELGQHNFRALEAGQYDLRVDTTGKVHIVH